MSQEANELSHPLQSGRVFAIGDVHGCRAALQGLLDRLDLQPADTVVTLGDYVNRGPDSRGVLQHLIDWPHAARLVPLLGNHEDLLLADWRSRLRRRGDAIHDPETGQERFDSEHFDFVASCRMWYEADQHFFVHANYQPDLDLGEQPRLTLLYLKLRDVMPDPHISGKHAVVGHTCQRDGRVLRREHLTCIDTFCYGGGWLTALEVERGTLWQCDREAMVHRPPRPIAECVS